MDYSMLPEKFKKEKIEELDKFIEKQDEKLKKSKKHLEKLEKSMKEAAYSKYLNKYPDGSFSDYLGTLAKHRYSRICFVFALIGAIVGMVSCFIGEPFAGVSTSVFTTYLTNMLMGAIAGFVGCFILRIPAAYFYGSLLFFVGYPIFRICYKAAENREYSRLKVVEKDIKERSERLEEEHKHAIDEQARKIVEEIDEYKAKFFDEAKGKSANLENSEAVKSIVVWSTSLFGDLISSAEHPSHIENIEVQMLMAVFSDGVECRSDKFSDDKWYSFEENRFADIERAIDGMAISMAIAKLVPKSIEEHYQGKISSEIIEEEAKAVISLKYTAKNENYKPVQKW